MGVKFLTNTVPVPDQRYFGEKKELGRNLGLSQRLIDRLFAGFPLRSLADISEAGSPEARYLPPFVLPIAKTVVEGNYDAVVSVSPDGDPVVWATGAMLSSQLFDHIKGSVNPNLRFYYSIFKNTGKARAWPGLGDCLALFSGNEQTRQQLTSLGNDFLFIPQAAKSNYRWAKESEDRQLKADLRKLLGTLPELEALKSARRVLLVDDLLTKGVPFLYASRFLRLLNPEVEVRALVFIERYGVSGDCANFSAKAVETGLVLNHDGQDAPGWHRFRPEGAHYAQLDNGQQQQSLLSGFSYADLTKYYRDYLGYSTEKTTATMSGHLRALETDADYQAVARAYLAAEDQLISFQLYSLSLLSFFANLRARGTTYPQSPNCGGLISAQWPK